MWRHNLYPEPLGAPLDSVLSVDASSPCERYSARDRATQRAHRTEPEGITKTEMNTLSIRRFCRAYSALVLGAAMLIAVNIGRPLAVVGDEDDKSRSASAVSPHRPEPLTAQHFAALKSHSPFLRSLDLSKTLVLTGVARVDGELVATLFDRESEKTQVVSQSANAQGWRLVDIQGDQKRLNSMTAQIAVSGGEVVSVRFDPGQIKVIPKASGPKIPADQAEYIAAQARNYRQGISGDGHRGPPPPELVKKLSQLSEQQRAVVIYQIREMRNKGVSSEDRQKAIVQMADRALQQRR